VNRAEGIMNVMNTNFFGAVNVTNAVLPHMRDRREGCVVFIGSRSAFRNQKIVRVLPPPPSPSNAVPSRRVLTPKFDRLQGVGS
jgi:NAD(P)-dependent dehydrogenase (short-subunit alcohol dehydrogenase family)